MAANNRRPQLVDEQLGKFLHNYGSLPRSNSWTAVRNAQMTAERTLSNDTQRPVSACAIDQQPHTQPSRSTSMHQFYSDPCNRYKSLPNRGGSQHAQSRQYLLPTESAPRAPGTSGQRYRKSFFRSGSIRSIRKWMRNKFRSSGSADDIKSQPHLNGYVQLGAESTMRPSKSDLTPNAPSVDSGLCEPRDTVDRPAVELPNPLLQGIANHGNTCYINAVMQCLANTDALAEYLVSEKFLHDLLDQTSHQQRNARRYGTDGAMTRALAQFLQCLWFNRYMENVSKNFKHLVGQFSADYSTPMQQDAQEFLMWLLDKVHEDLNVATHRKYKTAKGTKGHSSEDDLADEVLSKHRKAHCSYITRLFEAQFRSSVVCPGCREPKLNFDPYMCVSLPLPQNSTKPVFVTMVYRNRQPRQLRLGLNADITATLRDVKQCLAAEAKVHMQQLLMCDLSERGFQNTYADSVGIWSLKPGQLIYAVETDSPQTSLNGHREESPESADLVLLLCNALNSGNGFKRFGGPFCVRVSREMSYPELCSAILNTVRPQLKPDVSLHGLPESDLFRVRVSDEFSLNSYLPADVAMPLYTEHIERCLSFRGSSSSGPSHLKLIIEWHPAAAQRLLSSSEEPVLEHMSARDLRQEMQETRSYALHDCLRDYTKAEYLTDEWRCPNCKRPHYQAQKSLQFWSLPDVLVVHLKRFKQLRDGRQVKLDSVIEFPVNGLDLTRFTYQHGSTPVMWRRHTPSTRVNGVNRKNYKHHVSESVSSTSDCVYDLFAVCNHHGESVNSGHYTASCRNPLDGTWRHFDDKQMSTVKDVSQLCNSSAYLLFYERRGSTRRAVSRNSTESGFGEHWYYRLPDALLRRYCKLVPPDAHSVSATPPPKASTLSSAEASLDGLDTETEGSIPTITAGRVHLPPKRREPPPVLPKPHINLNGVEPHAQVRKDSLVRRRINTNSAVETDL